MSNKEQIKMLFESNYSVVVDKIHEDEDVIWVSYTPLTESDNTKYVARVFWYEDENKSGWKIAKILKSDKLIRWEDLGEEYDEVYEA